MCALWCVESRKDCLWPVTARTALSKWPFAGSAAISTVLLTAVNSWCSRGCQFCRGGFQKKRKLILWIHTSGPLHMPWHLCFSSLRNPFLPTSTKRPQTSDSPHITIFSSKSRLLSCPAVLAQRVSCTEIIKGLFQMYTFNSDPQDSHRLGWLVRERDKPMHVYWFLFEDLAMLSFMVHKVLSLKSPLTLSSAVQERQQPQVAER